VVSKTLHGITFTFFNVFTVFFQNPKNVTLRFFCFVAYVFSNYAWDTDDGNLVENGTVTAFTDVLLVATMYCCTAAEIDEVRDISLLRLLVANLKPSKVSQTIPKILIFLLINRLETNDDNNNS